VTSSLDSLEQLFLSPTTPTNERDADVVSGVTTTAISSLMTVHWPSSAVRRNEVEQVVLSDILNCLEDAIVSIDLDGRVTSWNRGAELLYGVSYEQAFAASVQEVLPSIAEDLFAVLNEDSAVALEQAEVKRTRRDGQHVLVQETISPIRNVTGRVIGALSRARSLAQLKEAERELDSTRRELELRNRRLEASNAELERFAFVTSRDLAEPLRAITGMVSLLERKYHDQLDQDANEYLRYTTKACGRLRAMITNLQSFSSSGSGKLQTETIELVRALDAAVSNMVLDLEHFEAEIVVGDLALVRADRTMVIQVFENILRHALAMHEDGEKFTIEVASIEAPNGFTKVSITDRSTGAGDGRPVSAVQMLQRPHVRNDFSSTGIDLAIAARIVDAHGGSFGSTGGLNDGSAIWFTLETAKDSSA
jgi:PAS domain S-box-containing protein